MGVTTTTASASSVAAAVDDELFDLVGKHGW